MITGIIVAAVVVGCVGIILGFFLGIAGEKFKVETDPREDAILEVLPGNNCGGCGYAGCSGLAAAIAKGEAPVNQYEPVAIGQLERFLGDRPELASTPKMAPKNGKKVAVVGSGPSVTT